MEEPTKIVPQKQGLPSSEAGRLILPERRRLEQPADENEWALLSGFMRASYAFAAKYLVEVNFRPGRERRVHSHGLPSSRGCRGWY